MGGPGASDVRTWHYRDFVPGALVEAKANQYVSVCLPALDEAATVGQIVTTIRDELVDRYQLVDEVIVVDDGSKDSTRRLAADAGARVVVAAEVLPEQGAAHGKGEALWKSLHAAKGDLLVYCDADIRDFSAHFVMGLLGPLLTDNSVGFVKGFYRRPVNGAEDGGGRVTELIARPLLRLLFPHLASVVQPLAGEFAGRRAVLEHVPFVQGYGVDVGLLIDTTARFGLGALAQVDLGSRTHRNRPLEQLGPQATVVAYAALRRAGVDLQNAPTAGLTVAERPPIINVAAYREGR